MGLALNELVSIKYLSKLDVQKMSSKIGYKIVLTAGNELLAVIENNRPERRELPSATDNKALKETEPVKLSQEQLDAVGLQN
jgi:hypothetical protein